VSSRARIATAPLWQRPTSPRREFAPGACHSPCKPHQCSEHAIAGWRQGPWSAAYHVRGAGDTTDCPNTAVHASKTPRSLIAITKVLGCGPGLRNAVQQRYKGTTVRMQACTSIRLASTVHIHALVAVEMGVSLSHTGGSHAQQPDHNLPIPMYSRRSCAVPRKLPWPSPEIFACPLSRRGSSDPCLLAGVLRTALFVL
jgi:hypothetical protein